MSLKIITTPFIFRITVNCYLLETDSGFILIDTGRAKNRSVIDAELNRAGCKPGDLSLIVLTHGDFDHCGNAAYFREKFGAKITIHEADLGMVERGDLTWNRKQPNLVMQILLGLLFRLDKTDQFKPDFFIQEGDNLSAYGFDAEVIELPGHSKGSIGLLTGEGDLFCGDLLANVDKPDLWSIMDDRGAANASVAKLKGKMIHTVYPGHGQPFVMEAYMKHTIYSVV